MIKRGLFILLILALAVLAGQQLLKGTGYLLLVLPDGKTSIEMSFWTGLVILLVSWLAAAWLFNLLGWLSHPLAGLKDRHKRNRAQRALKLTVKGLVDLAEGRWRRARKLLAKSAKNSGAPLINYLAAAQAAHYEGREETAENLLKAAAESTPDASLAVDFSQARIQLDHGHYEQALATLVRLHQKVPNHPLVLRQLKEVHYALADWKPLMQLLPEFRKYQICSGKELELLEREVYLRRFDELLRSSTTSEGGFKAIKELWETLPGRLKAEDELVLAYSRVLIKQQRYAEAEQLLKRTLRDHWSPRLIAEYGVLPLEAEPKRRLLEAEKWLQERPNDAVLLHALARISQQLGLWGKALEYFQASQRLEPKDQVCAEMSRLYAALGDENKSRYFNQLAMQGMHRQLPELPLPSHPPG
ncbi:heme biosynthesis HemY N-terminal domain-containing protein [Marinospirillum sp.]|uniref:heme biosynthesis protein HemY n=1 Tax=Marinospirillum sp. TaxID=2183934 RepID=UPI00286FECB6|nr:heme biosynthesis HemY N-terminal domain-containing protein [Marinospirillum sp.]MDR9466948.1 heme biosynthesis HemY N-terminal domain-containing protein [Marinospirillum sp.]